MQALIELGDSERATRMVDGMSRMLRYVASDESRWSRSGGGGHVRDYMALMQVRYGEKLRFEFDPGDLPDEMAVPKLSIQPLVENAVKYGCAGAPPWHIRLKLSRFQEGWRAEVTDDGAGFDPRRSAR